MTRESAIETAQALGSSATTTKGAIRYLRAHSGWGTRSLWGMGRPWRAGTYITTRALYRAHVAREKQEARAIEICRDLGLWIRAEAEAEAKAIEATICAHVAGEILSAWPYRRSTSRWAGGVHTVSVEIAEGRYGHARCGASRTWSANGRWSGTSSHSDVRLPLSVIQSRRYLVAGLLHTAWRDLGPRVARATWYVQGRGVSLREQSGYVIRGHHVPCGESPAALARARRVADEARRATLRARLADRVSSVALRRVWVGADDSISAGNCATGTAQGVAAILSRIDHDGDVGAIRADRLLALRDDIYTRRAVSAAIAR